jgi:hypothetical protein
VCDIFGTHEARSRRVIIETWDDDAPKHVPDRVFLSDVIDLSERAEERLISFIERGLRPPSKKVKETEHGD